MKRIALVLAILMSALTFARAADVVSPATLSVTNFRGVAAGEIASFTEFYIGSSLLLTNCTMYTGTNSASAVQGLDAVTIQVTLGNSSITPTELTDSSIVASNGTWWASATLPSIGSSGLHYNLQVKITDANTNSYIYPWLELKTKPAL